MTTYGCICDRCSKGYRTNNWPAASLCGRCDVDQTNGVWSYKPQVTR